ncbi:MAG: hypothetical protein NTV56_00205 [Alphaproteobacteria bacterium]|nr:hypothetical protein [Alphaproteobacteria bacterium]
MGALYHDDYIGGGLATGSEIARHPIAGRWQMTAETKSALMNSGAEEPPMELNITEIVTEVIYQSAPGQLLFLKPCSDHRLELLVAGQRVAERPDAHVRKAGLRRAKGIDDGLQPVELRRDGLELATEAPTAKLPLPENVSCAECRVRMASGLVAPPSMQPIMSSIRSFVLATSSEGISSKRKPVVHRASFSLNCIRSRAGLKTGGPNGLER